MLSGTGRTCLGWDGDAMGSAAWQREYVKRPHVKAKRLAYYKKYWAARPEAYRAMVQRRRLKYLYKLTVEEWNAIFTAQGYCCAICKSRTSGHKNGSWLTDHDHKTGIVRGIVCLGCNSMLGNSKDDPSILRAGAKYLEEQEK